MDAHARMQRSLLGVSLGDAFGERFFGHQGQAVQQMVADRTLPAAPWPVTDDTMLALGVVDCLTEDGTIEPRRLQARLHARYRWDTHRGYGYGMHKLFGDIEAGRDGMQAAAEMFGGTGSMGNGSAMRVAPLGAFFADDPVRCAEEAARSAMATHQHAEGVAGAVATAVTTAMLWCLRDEEDPSDAIFEAVLAACGPGEVREGLDKAAGLSRTIDAPIAALHLGSGQRILAQDTVPYCVWVALQHRSSLEEALWQTVSGLGDRDTTCAIVGGMLAASVPESTIPREWLAFRAGPDLPDL